MPTKTKKKTEPPVTSIESQVYIDGGAKALKAYRKEMATTTTRTLWLVYEEDDAVDQDTSVLCACWTEEEAQQAVKDYEDAALKDEEAPQRVHGREEDWQDQDADEADWTKCYGYWTVEIPWPPPEFR